jgi:hypothetical protein
MWLQKQTKQEDTPMKTFKNLCLASLAMTLLFLRPMAWAGDRAPQTLIFEKCFNEKTQTWEGSVHGDAGTGHVSYVDLPPFWGKKTQHFSGEYTVTIDNRYFRAAVSGVWNSETGQIVLNGFVTEDSQLYAGSQFNVRAEWDGGQCSHGTMTITPSK